MRAARRRLSYETWSGSTSTPTSRSPSAFLHQLFVGRRLHARPAGGHLLDRALRRDRGLVIAFRFGQPILTTLRHRFRVAASSASRPMSSPSTWTAGDLDRLAVRSGQYFVLRFLTRDDWWRAHPYSISSAPNGRWLRFTVKDLGDDSARVPHLAVGTRAFVEGPYGVLTGARAPPAVTLIGGGIGITAPGAARVARAAPGELTLIYRASHPSDLVFREQLDTLAQCAAPVSLPRRLAGEPRGRLPAPASTRPRSRASCRIASHDVYVCGPKGLMEGVIAALDELGVPRAGSHAERFAY